jgi:type I restriction enzyme M protein
LEISTIDPAVSKHVQVFALAELIDFDSIDFDKKLSTETISKTNWEDVWGSTDIKTLSPDIATIQKGSSITKAKTVNGKIPVVAGGQQPAYFHNVANRPNNIITVSASGAYAGFLNFWDNEIFASDCTTIKSINEDEISTGLLYEILKIVQPEIYKLQRGQAQPHVYPRNISKIKIPVPNKEQQKLIKKDLAKLNSDRGKYLAKGVAVQDLEKVLQDEKKKIIVKHCFKSN